MKRKKARRRDCVNKTQNYDRWMWELGGRLSAIAYSQTTKRFYDQHSITTTGFFSIAKAPPNNLLFWNKKKLKQHTNKLNSSVSCARECENKNNSFFSVSLKKQTPLYSIPFRFFFMINKHKIFFSLSQNAFLFLNR